MTREMTRQEAEEWIRRLLREHLYWQKQLELPFPKRAIPDADKTDDHDAFKAHFARLGENGRSVSLDVLVEAQAWRGPGQDGGECGLAHLKWLAAQIGAGQLHQIAGVGKHPRVGA